MSKPLLSRAGHIGRGTLLAFALLLAAAATYILFIPVDPSNFESTTGTTWESFATPNPETADYLTREGRLLAVGYLSFALLVAAVAWWPLRRGDGWTKKALWLFPACLCGAGAVFLGSGDVALGGTYLAAGAITAAALTLAVRR